MPASTARPGRPPKRNGNRFAPRPICYSSAPTSAQSSIRFGWNVIATMRSPKLSLFEESDRLLVNSLDVTDPKSVKNAIEVNHLGCDVYYQDKPLSCTWIGMIAHYYP